MNKCNSLSILAILSILYFLSSCTKDLEKENKNVIISLKSVSSIKKGLKFNNPVSFLDESDVPVGYKKELEGDSIRIGYISFIGDKDLNELVANSLIDQNAIDTVKKGIYFLTGIADGKQFFSADLNHNRTFNDDKTYIFSTEITYKTKTNLNLDSLFPSKKIIVTKLSGSHFYKDTLFAKIYPNYNYFGYPKMDDKIRLKKRLQLVFRTTDNYLGTFSLEKEKFKVTVSKSKNLRNQIRFALYNSDFSYESYLRYRLKDTIHLNNENFLIDTLLYAPSRLVLKPLNIKRKAHGYTEGAKLYNYIIEDLKGNNVALNKLTSKKLLLLDFWGTWCAPCMELTPDLINLSKKYQSKMNIVSLAYQEDVKPVQKYVAENKMNWFNGIVIGKQKSLNQKSKIIKELRVKSFPTFILVDKDFNIVFRISGGGENFKKLAEVIDKY